MFHSKFHAATKLLLATIVLLNNPSSCRAGLCEDNSDICTLRTGTYTDHDNEVRNWWAYVPKGRYACPSGGCPLYVYTDGTWQDAYKELPEQHYMMEMLKRGFVAATVEYDNSLEVYVSGCDGMSFIFEGGLNGMTQEIYDPSIGDSVVNQLCDKNGAPANCDLGIATHGHSQGAHVAALASNFDNRVSASLLFGNGHQNTVSNIDFPCLRSEQLSLPRYRRRSIEGSDSEYFGGSFDGVYQQQVATSGYDCGSQNNCFMNGNKINDSYIGGGAQIEDFGGYHIVTGDEFCEYMQCDAADGAPHGFFQEYAPASDFMNPATVWGVPQNLDWLAKTAKITAASTRGGSPANPPPTPNPTNSPPPPPPSGPSCAWWQFWC